eukprot:643209-Hanusia_phi.AAC.1
MFARFLGDGLAWQTESRNVRVVYNPGAVAAGMSVVMEIEINAEEQGRVVDEIVVETEKEVNV